MEANAQTRPTKPHTYKRYERAAKAPALELAHPGANYREILKALYVFRFLTTEHVSAYLGSRGSGVYRPLSRLYHAGFVERRYLFDRPVGVGSPQTIHVLTPAGARALLGEHYTAAAGERSRQLLKHGRAKLAHDLAVAEFHLLLHLGAALHRFNPDKEDVRTRIRVRIPTGNQGELRMHTRWPDAFLTAVNQSRAYHYLVEIDLDDQKPRKRARVAERFLAYAAALHEGVIAAQKAPGGPPRGQEPLWRHLGLSVPSGAPEPRRGPTVHVLFVTPTAARRDELISIAEALRAARGSVRLRQSPFWFVARDDYVIRRASETRRDLLDLERTARRLCTAPVLRGLNNKPSHLLP